MRPVIVILLAALAAGSVSASVAAAPRTMNAPPPRTAPSGFDEAIRQAGQALDLKDWQGVYDALKPLIGTEELAAQPSARRHAVLGLFASAALLSGHGADALPALKVACDLPEAASQDWVMRTLAAWVAKDGAEVALSMATVAERWPDQVKLFDFQQIVGLHNEVSRLEGSTRPLEQFDAALFKAGWRPETPAKRPDFIWVEYAGLLLDRGDVAGARKVVGQITGAREIVQMRADKRFDPIVRRGDPAFDPRKAAEAELARLTAAAQAAPDNLELLLAQATEMRRLGQTEAASALVEAAIARVQAKGDAAFSDLEDQKNWLYDLQARLLMDRGRIDEALAIQIKAAALQEEGGDNTSQVLNLGAKYVSVGRPKEALAAIVKVGGMSPYGEMVRLYVDGCARAQLGEAAKVQADIAEMRKLWPVNADALQGLLLCAGDLDGAAKVLIQRLDDARERGNILRDLQEFHDRPFDPPFTKRLDERSRLLVGRPDVKAAIARYGRVETYDDLWAIGE